MPKYVAPRTLKEPLEWENSTLLTGDLVAELTALKKKLGGDKDIVIMGNGELIKSPAQNNLVDRYVLLIYPLVLGSGRRLFTEGT